MKGRTTKTLKMREKSHFRDVKRHSHNDACYLGDFAFLLVAMSYNDVSLHTVALSSYGDYLIVMFA